MFTVYLFYAGDISQSVRDLLLLSGFYVKKVDSRFAAQPYVILLVYVTISSRKHGSPYSSNCTYCISVQNGRGLNHNEKFCLVFL